MLFGDDFPALSRERSNINADYLADEKKLLQRLIVEADCPEAMQKKIALRATRLVTAVREYTPDGLDALLQEYDLSSEEGVALMCLAEALLRIPDPDTADRLIREKLAAGNWQTHLGNSDSILVNASTWGLMLTGRLVKFDTESKNLSAVLNRLLNRASEPVMRLAMVEAMRILGQQFVMGQNIEAALKRSSEYSDMPCRFSYDMLGESAITTADAERYLQAYEDAIVVLGSHSNSNPEIESAAGISVKLSALHPRLESAKHQRVMHEIVPRLQRLTELASHHRIGLTIDAEETDRLDLTLDVFTATYTSAVTADWQGLGLAVQAYQKRARAVLDYLATLAQTHRRRIMLRLVKGAYWDTEIKLAQQQGWCEYPVFTRKSHTDVCYLACAKKLLAHPDLFYPQFATHNARTVAAVIELAGDNTRFEFQRLHGMGEALYQHVQEKSKPQVACRVYAPVGRHEDLLPYLVRRLLENGANTSFVNRITDLSISVDEIVADPTALTRETKLTSHPAIPLPKQIFGDERRNATGLNLNDPQQLIELDTALEDAVTQSWQATPTFAQSGNKPKQVVSPANHADIIGSVFEANTSDVAVAIENADKASAEWSVVSADQRAEILERAADLIEAEPIPLLMLIVREGGRCIADAQAEIRETVDYCRYYANQIRSAFPGESLPGPTGEINTLTLHPRGVFACISPWNFPAAIFTGQVTAALAAGNAVLAKPARLSPLTAAYIVDLLYKAGVPEAALVLLPGNGAEIGSLMLADERVRGVVFTGSMQTARIINRQLANRTGAITPLIAETGGQNVMIVDSSALAEQVTLDVLQSAFNSAGQRCSALRVLFLQNEIADKIIQLLTGAMDELSIGDPMRLATDIGPVISTDAQRTVNEHITRLHREAKPLHTLALPEATHAGTFVAPALFEIDQLEFLQREIFGPVLHIIRYSAHHLDHVIQAINATGYGLTLGIHSRLGSTQQYVAKRVRVGNIYINRNMIGAVVGVQPFGGEGLSGTGPKAGGPNYLRRFATERVTTTNSTAVGGNTSLLALHEGD